MSTLMKLQLNGPKLRLHNFKYKENWTKYWIKLSLNQDWQSLNQKINLSLRIKAIIPQATFKILFYLIHYIFFLLNSFSFFLCNIFINKISTSLNILLRPGFGGKPKSLWPFQVDKILYCTFAMLFTFSVIYKFSHAWKIIYSKIQKLSVIKDYLKID